MSRTFGNFYTLLYFYSALCAFLTKNSGQFMPDTHIEALHLLLGQTFLKKGSSPGPFPKTSNFVFSARGTPI